MTSELRRTLRSRRGVLATLPERLNVELLDIDRINEMKAWDYWIILGLSVAIAAALVGLYGGGYSMEYRSQQFLGVVAGVGVFVFGYRVYRA